MRLRLTVVKEISPNSELANFSLRPGATAPFSVLCRSPGCRKKQNCQNAPTACWHGPLNHSES